MVLMVFHPISICYRCRFNSSLFPHDPRNKPFLPSTSPSLPFLALKVFPLDNSSETLSVLLTRPEYALFAGSLRDPTPYFARLPRIIIKMRRLSLSLSLSASRDSFRSSKLRSKFRNAWGNSEHSPSFLMRLE